MDASDKVVCVCTGQLNYVEHCDCGAATRHDSACNNICPGSCCAIVHWTNVCRNSIIAPLGMGYRLPILGADIRVVDECPTSTLNDSYWMGLQCDL